MAFCGIFGLALFVSSILDGEMSYVQEIVDTVNYYECSYLENDNDPQEYYEKGNIVKKDKGKQEPIQVYNN